MDTPSQSSGEMISSPRLILFSHEFPVESLTDLFGSLQRHSRERRLPLLAGFLAECTVVLREEVLKLPRQLQHTLPPFKSVMTLATNLDELRKTPIGGAWEGALLCVLELAMFIGFV
jgi:hypothetical protein